MPLFKEKWHVPEELLDELRTRFVKELNAGPEVAEIYHPDDVRQVKESDWFIARYLLHTELDVDKALLMLKDSLKFRNDMEVNTVRKKDLPKEYFNVRAVIIYNLDVRDHPVVVVRGKTHIKREDTRRLQQQYFLYWVEKATRASYYGAISILFDCTDAGVSNMDLDMIRFMLNVFKRYYPWGLCWFLVLNMPWYLSAFWKLVKQWIPAKYVGKIVFVDTNSIQEYITEENLPVCYGGKCTKLYAPKEGVEEADESDEDEVITAM